MQGKNEPLVDLFGDRLKRARKANNLTQEELAKKLGFSRYGTIQRWENNERKLNISKVDLLCSVLKVSLNWLLKGDIDNRLCKQIIAAMFDQGIKSGEFAKRLGVERTFIEAIRDRSIMPSEEFINNVASELGYNVLSLKDGPFSAVPPLKSTGKPSEDVLAAKVERMEKEIYDLKIENKVLKEIIGKGRSEGL